MADRTNLEQDTQEQRLENEPVAGREPWPEEEEQQPKGKAGSYFRAHPRARFALFIILLVLIVAGVAAWRYYSVRESTDDAQIDGHIAPVSARVSGTVIAVQVDDNQRVEKGQVLVVLDPRDYQVAVERAQAELADAEASAQAAGSGVPITTRTTSSQVIIAQAALHAARQEVESATASLREAQANQIRVNADLNRLQQLVAKDEVSRQTYDAQVSGAVAAQSSVEAASAMVAVAQSHVAQAEAQLRAAQTAPEQVRVTQARYAAAQAAVQKNAAALQQAELNLKYTTIVAPFDGVVSKKNVEPGQVVQPGQPLVSVVNLEDVWVTANFKENELRQMRVGQPAKVEVDAYGRTYEAHVDSFSGATGARFSLLPPENATGNYVKVVQRVPVKICFEKGENVNHLLRPGMSVVATVKTGK